jgi:hypothetical protein
MFEAVGAIIIAILRVGVPIYVAALIATSILLFLSNSVAHQIGIEEVRQSYKGYLGLAFVASLSLLAATGISFALSAVNNHFEDWAGRRRLLQTLRMLTVDEKQFLRPFILDGENTVLAPLSDGVAGGLVAKTLIYRSSNLIEHFTAPFNLQPVARKLLTENPYLLN